MLKKSNIFLPDNLYTHNRHKLTRLDIALTAIHDIFRRLCQKPRMIQSLYVFLFSFCFCVSNDFDRFRVLGSYTTSTFSGRIVKTVLRPSMLHEYVDSLSLSLRTRITFCRISFSSPYSSYNYPKTCIVTCEYYNSVLDY